MIEYSPAFDISDEQLDYMSLVGKGVTPFVQEVEYLADAGPFRKGERG